MGHGDSFQPVSGPVVVIVDGSVVVVVMVVVVAVVKSQVSRTRQRKCYIVGAYV